MMSTLKKGVNESPLSLSSKIHSFKKRHFTLLEVIIATSLLAILLAAVMFFYRQIDWINSEMEKIEKTKFLKSYIENRLANIIPRATPVTNSKQEFYFFSTNDSDALFKPGSTSLVFTYDNKDCLNKPFSNTVLGRLFLDKEGRFALATWPVPKRWEADETPPIKNEILLENVESLSFEFYVPPEKDITPISQVNSDKQYLKKRNAISPGWHKEWKNEYQQLPALVKVRLKLVSNNNKEQEEITFVFPSACSNYFIVYG